MPSSWHSAALVPSMPSLSQGTVVCSARASRSSVARVGA
ncbi:Uncharacterised protein [Bordetella pertussis]|nr:Uncharacterised protein [Bordetella pertussis]CFP60114.1 Uncharacterised protein [Bordetella pertussis]